MQKTRNIQKMMVKKQGKGSFGRLDLDGRILN
jgi:hypothetical protein